MGVGSGFPKPTELVRGLSESPDTNPIMPCYLSKCGHHMPSDLCGPLAPDLKV